MHQDYNKEETNSLAIAYNEGVVRLSVGLGDKSITSQYEIYIENAKWSPNGDILAVYGPYYNDKVGLGNPYLLFLDNNG